MDVRIPILDGYTEIIPLRNHAATKRR